MASVQVQDLELLKDLGIIEQDVPSTDSTNTASGGDYIDVRGPHPVYINGFRCFRMEDADRGITLVEARQKFYAAE